MAGITLEQAQARLTAYLDAEAAVLLGQSYEIAGRRLTRADLGNIQSGIDIWNQRVQSLTNRAAGRARAVTTTPGW
jgi:hypothetical protein